MSACWVAPQCGVLPGRSTAGFDGLHSWSLMARSRSAGPPMLCRQLGAELAARGEITARWLEAVARNARLTHPACARPVRWGEHRGRAFALSSCVHGAPLRLLLRDPSDASSRLPCALSVHVACVLLEASAHASEQEPPLIHLDLDPDGVIVREDGALLLPEFGLWRALGPDEIARRRFACGRVRYASPELLSATASDVRSDIFSIGAILFELLTGRCPFEGATQLAIALAIAEGRRPAVRELAPALSPALSEVVEAMLAKRADARFQSPAAAIEALRSAVEVPNDASAALAAQVATALAAPMEVASRSAMPARAELEHARTRSMGVVPGLAPSPPHAATRSRARGAMAAVTRLITPDFLKKVTDRVRGAPRGLPAGAAPSPVPPYASEGAFHGAAVAPSPPPLVPGVHAPTQARDPQPPALIAREDAGSVADPRLSLPGPDRLTRALRESLAAGGEDAATRDVAGFPGVRPASMMQADATTPTDPLATDVDVRWRDPSPTLFALRVSSVQEPLTDPSSSRWAARLRLCFFGLCGVAGLYLLVRLWQ